MDFEVRILKNKSGYRTSSSKVSCVLIFRPNGQLLLFRPKFAQKMILGSEFQNSKPGFGISTSMGANFQAKRITLNFRPKFAEKWFLRLEFRNSKPGFAPPIYHVCQFKGKKDNFEFLAYIWANCIFGLYFGSYNVEAVAESWVDA